MLQVPSDGETIVSQTAHGEFTQNLRPQTKGVDEKGEGPTTYVVSLPRILQSVRFLVPGCPAVAHSAVRLQEIFMF